RLVITFAARWDDTVRDDAPSRVTYEIEQQGECCKLTVVHDEFEGETQTYQLVGNGWPVTLAGIKTLLETGKPLNYDPMARGGAAESASKMGRVLVGSHLSWPGLPRPSSISL